MYNALYEQEPAHSDDILMGLAVPHAYRFIPPHGSLLDFDAICRKVPITRRHCTAVLNDTTVTT